MGEITTEEELRAHYGAPTEISAKKSLPALDKHSIRFIELSPFIVLGTADSEGNCEVSPRGDAPGFVRVVDPNRIQIPDRIGNNRADSNQNIVSNPKASVIFFVPGLGETLRVRGSIRLSIDEDLRASLATHGKDPRAVLEMTIERVFFQCQKALIRSHLWDPATLVDRQAAGVASLGAVFADQIDDLTPDRAEDILVKSNKERMW